MYAMKTYHHVYKADTVIGEIIGAREWAQI